MIQKTEADLFAAIDLGSNSFHLIVARESHGQLQVIDRIKEMVRLASGIDEQGILSQAKADIAIDCLARFGQRLRDIDGSRIRIVGTNALRKAKNSHDFLTRAEQAVNHEVEIIAGREEARLIYLGVSHGQSDNSSQRLVMDIGGGSTEFIIGKGFDPILTESLHMGCVSMSQFAFADGKINETNFSKAILHAEQELRSIRQQYLRTGWNLSTGSSGTIKAVGKVLATQFKNSYQGITPEGLLWLKQAMINQKKVSNLDLPGLSEERFEVFAGGVAILIATFEILQINLMTVSDSALREGLIYDMLGRINHEDVRTRTIINLTNLYHVETKQVERVSNITLHLYDLLKEQWPINNEDIRQDLIWAAQLHEVGLTIAHNQYHKHGAYIIENSDMPGFSKLEQKRLSILIRSQRRKFPLSELKGLSVHCYKQIVFQSVIFRLAIIFKRGRSDKDFPKVKITAEYDSLTIQFPPNYLEAHPLTHADLLEEVNYLKSIDFKLILE